MVSSSTILASSFLVILSATTSASTWSCVNGFTSPMKIAIDGNIECWSDNGHDCAWGANCAALVASNAEPKQPLACGCQTKASWGITGYYDANGNYAPNHWCNLVKIALGANPPNPACTIAPSTIAPTPAPTTTTPAP
ncbi:Aste57867_3919 [Aphanomyces stellatus]|uniref:Aste57867_3919 protein n=1 Tax=Aphanomyces stellatus TaxID=120398 RepID=A0A485KF03_9STRA|nr:hypothetical protein As57867_003908 [Aphanomyces stellatus]VFT81058.1 Aste57867_3919 [Aphanomyces stellatus]